MSASTVEPIYFADAAALWRWFDAHAGTAAELVVGFMKKGCGGGSISWPEAVDEALCVGWIDGVRHRIDDARYKIRFTPRRPGSTWSPSISHASRCCRPRAGCGRPGWPRSAGSARPERL